MNCARWNRAILSSVHHTTRTRNGRASVVLPVLTEYDSSLLVVIVLNSSALQTSSRPFRPLARNWQASASQVLHLVDVDGDRFARNVFVLHEIFPSTGVYFPDPLRAANTSFVGK